MKRISCISLFCALGITYALAQQLTPSVISVSGGFYANSSGMLSFTTGEMAAIETYSSPGSILTQGFQQAWDFSTGVIDHPSSGLAFAVYPNPSYGNFSVMTQSPQNANAVLKVIDILGQEVFSKDFEQQSPVNIQSLDLSHLPSGTYMLALHVKAKQGEPIDLLVTKIQILK